MLLLPAILWREIEERTRSALPLEACGFLIGRRRGEEFEVAALAPGRNVAREARTHFEIDALDVLAAEDGARDAGLEVLGVWHSHPRGPLAPSAADRGLEPAGRGGPGGTGARGDSRGKVENRQGTAAGAPSQWLTVIVVPEGTCESESDGRGTREGSAGIRLGCWRRVGAHGFEPLSVGQPCEARR